MHEDGNEWGIELDAGEDDHVAGNSVTITAAHTVPESSGLRRQYEDSKTAVNEADCVQVGENESLDDLALQFASM